MAGFATEAAFYGRPAVVTGYFAQSLEQLVPSPVPPTLHARPEGLVQAIELLASDPGFRADLGQQARRFVADTWAPSDVAKRLLSLLDGTAAKRWWVDPNSVTYCHGWGMNETLLTSGLRALIDQRGSGSLAMDHRPLMKRSTGSDGGRGSPT